MPNGNRILTVTKTCSVTSARRRDSLGVASATAVLGRWRPRCCDISSEKSAQRAVALRRFLNKKHAHAISNVRDKLSCAAMWAIAAYTSTTEAAESTKNNETQMNPASRPRQDRGKDSKLKSKNGSFSSLVSFNCSLLSFVDHRPTSFDDRPNAITQKLVTSVTSRKSKSC